MTDGYISLVLVVFMIIAVYWFGIYGAITGFKSKKIAARNAAIVAVVGLFLPFLPFISIVGGILAIWYSYEENYVDTDPSI